MIENARRKIQLSIIGAGVLFLTGTALFLVSRSQKKHTLEEAPMISEGQDALTRWTVRAWMNKNLSDTEAELVSLETMGEEKQGVISVWAKIREKNSSGEHSVNSYPMEIEWRTRTVLAWDVIRSPDPN